MKKIISSLLQDLRKQLDNLLEEKISRPGVTNWDPRSKEGAVLQAITSLITTEETQSYHPSDFNSKTYHRKSYR